MFPRAEPLTRYAQGEKVDAQESFEAIFLETTFGDSKNLMIPKITLKMAILPWFYRACFKAMLK